MTENLFKVFLNGNMVARNEAWMSIDSVAFKYAAMVFEGIRGYWNERERQLYVFRLADHAQRLQESVQLMGMETELGAADFSRAVLQAIEANAVSQHVHIRQLLRIT